QIDGIIARSGELERQMTAEDQRRARRELETQHSQWRERTAAVAAELLSLMHEGQALESQIKTHCGPDGPGVYIRRQGLAGRLMHVGASEQFELMLTSWIEDLHVMYPQEVPARAHEVLAAKRKAQEEEERVRRERSDAHKAQQEWRQSPD